MITYNRICIKDHTIADSEGTEFTVKRGHEYLTSSDKNGEVTVFADYWFKAPVDIFAGEIQFTGSKD